jgi:hypothetical protein
MNLPITYHHIIVSGKVIGMKRYMIGITLMLLGMVFAASCGIGASSLSQQQIQEYAQQQNIQPLAIEDVGGQATAILFKDKQSVGCYVAWARNGIESHRKQTSIVRTGQEVNDEPISVITTAVFDHEIACILFNDQNITKHAQYVEAILPNGLRSTNQMQNQNNMILFWEVKEYYDSIDIVIYDKDRQEILHILAWGGTEVTVK